MAEVTLKAAAHHVREQFARTPFVRPSGVNDDPFHDPVLRWIGVAFVLLIVAIVLLTGLVQWGVEYQSPAWNSHAYPPAIAH
jgi:hypothetical protein